MAASKAIAILELRLNLIDHTSFQLRIDAMIIVSISLLHYGTVACEILDFGSDLQQVILLVNWRIHY